LDTHAKSIGLAILAVERLPEWFCAQRRTDSERPTFVQRIAAALGDFPEKLVSVASCLDAVPDGFQRVPDLVPQIGQLGEFTLFNFLPQ
jgi:hypothetical protein